jgi:hypothetical protein
MGDASETAGPATSQIHAQMLRYRHRQSRIADAELRPTILTGNYLGAAPAAVSLVRPSSRHRIRCSALTHRGIPAIRKERVIGREDVGSASGPASLALIWRGRRVGGLGPGLTSESADAARAVLRIDLSAGPRFLWHPPALPV